MWRIGVMRIDDFQILKIRICPMLKFDIRAAITVSKSDIIAESVKSNFIMLRCASAV